MVLAQEGAALGVADVLPEVENTAAEIQKIGRRSVFAVFDISDPAQVQKGVAIIRDKLGDIDILVNNAGIVTNIARLTKMTHEAWQREISVNLSGAFYMIQQVIGKYLIGCSFWWPAQTERVCLQQSRSFGFNHDRNA
jgi:NAD(P)-dependent dehydrogenase (short-subunit alcohol dehydrogenase family)